MLCGGHRACHFAGGQGTCAWPCSAGAEPASNAGRATDGPDSQDHEGEAVPIRRRHYSALRSHSNPSHDGLEPKSQAFSLLNYKKFSLNHRFGPGQLGLRHLSTDLVHALVVWASRWAGPGWEVEGWIQMVKIAPFGEHTEEKERKGLDFSEKWVKMVDIKGL